MAIPTSETSTTILRGRPRTDAELARAAGRGDVEAFEALYERHHRGLLSFSRHMLGGVHDAEDVVQHTFLAADAAFRKDRVPSSVRAWLYTVARNRCISVIRARRNDRELPDPGVPSTENLVHDVEQREELRELLADLRTLPDDQRAALLLAELGELSHAEVGQVIGVRTPKVKALVFQARSALMAAADARAIPCRSIREELAVATGAARRRRHLREHLTRCEGCRAYADRVAAQRASVAAILPVVPTVALREGVLASIGTGSAAAAGGAGAGAGLGLLAAKSTAAKALAVVAIGGTAAGGGTVAVSALDEPARERAARTAPAAVAPAAEVETGTPVAAPEGAPQRAAGAPGGTRRQARSRRGAEGRRADERTVSRPAKRAGKRRQAAAGNGPRGKPETPRARALGRAKQEGRGKPPQASSPAAKPAGGKPAPPARPSTPAAPRSAAAPAQAREPRAAAGGQAPRPVPAPAGRARTDRTEKQPARSTGQVAPSE